MSLNIKNERTHQLVRELAQRTGVSQVAAVEDAVRVRLEALGAEGREGRLDRATVELAELRALLTDEDREILRRAEQDLYDDDGLPR